jgi:hypothetical protein
MLSVSGQMQLDGDGNGSFFATVFQFGGGAIPVFPVAKIEGTVKAAALGQALPPLTGHARLIASVTDPDTTGPSVVRSGVIVCPAGFYQPDSAALQAVGTMGQGGFAQASSGAVLIVDPAVATTAGTDAGGLASVGAKRERAAAGHELLGPGLARVQLRWWLL